MMRLLPTHQRRLAATAVIIVTSVSGYIAVGSPATAAVSPNVVWAAAAGGPAAAVVTATHTTDSDALRQSSSFPIGGVLVDEAGTPISNVDVQVDLYPGPDLMKKTIKTHEPALSVPIGLAKTDDTGAFTLRVPALKSIGDYLFRDGSVRLLVSSVDANHSFFYSVTAVLPKAVNVSAVVPVADSDVVGAADGIVAAHKPVPLTPKGSRSIASSDPSAVDASDARNVPLDGLLLRADTTAPGARFAVRAANPDPAKLCLESVGIHVYGWELADHGFAEDSPLQAVYTLGKTTVKYDWSDVTTYEVNTAFDLSYKSTRQRGGFSKTWEGGIGGTANIPKKFAGFVRTKVEHRFNYLYCYKPQKVFAHVTEYVPYTMIGGAENYKTADAKVSCKKGIGHALISPGNSVMVSKKASTKISAGISVLGLSLDTSMTNNANNTKTFTNSADTNTYICGNNNYVAKASTVREVKN